jgi:DNA-binding MarR family transcriptional regulator
MNAESSAENPAYAPGSMVLLTRLAKQVYRRSGEELLGMHLRHLMALSYLRDHDGSPQQELAEALCMDANNVVLLLNELEEREHITRRRDPNDRRRHLVDLTAAGRRALRSAEHAQESIEDELLHALDAEERTVLWRLLSRALYSSEPATPANDAAATPANQAAATPVNDAELATPVHTAIAAEDTRA